MAADFVAHGGTVTSGFADKPEAPHQEYRTNLREWASFDSQEKLAAILAYVEKGFVVSDLITANLLPVDKNGKLLSEWDAEKESMPIIFRAVGNPVAARCVRPLARRGKKQAAGTWQDTGLIELWIKFYRHRQSKRGFCQVSGDEAALAIQYPS